MQVQDDHNEPGSSESGIDETGMDALMAKLSDQQSMNAEKDNGAPGHHFVARVDSGESASSSVPRTPATDAFSTTPPTEGGESDTSMAGPKTEMERLKMELDAAKDQLAKQERELSHNRFMQNASDNGKTGVPMAHDNVATAGIDRTILNMQDAYGASRSMVSYGPQDDARSDVSEALSSAGFNGRAHAYTPAAGFQGGMQGAGNVWSPGPGRPWINRPMAPAVPPVMVPPPHQVRSFSGAASPVGNSSTKSDFPQHHGNGGPRRHNMSNMRSVTTFGPNRGPVWESYGHGGETQALVGMGQVPFQSMGMFQTPMGFQPRAMGTPLSPTAAEFTSSGALTPWNATVSQLLSSCPQANSIKQPSSPGQTYVPPMEPLNYRRLLDRSVTCNWKYIVDKIVCNNDQQASIFLQQKLKVGTAEQKFEIVEAIIAQAYPLMVNRFGNFLVQRCFEHGTPEQVIAIANAIRGNTLSLSMDAFGCHVVQKAFDAVPEEYKAIMVHELLRRIPETVIHRYACHVWQKLFELRWSDSPPQIMKFVNEALRGMWHEVALGETGSLVVQNIFENCLEEDKVRFLILGVAR